MKRSRKAQIKELLQRKESCRWDIAEIHSSDMDPDMKALYLNDEQYEKTKSEYTLGQIGMCEELRDELVIVLKFLK
jgi:hypothetical protein